MSPVPGLTLEVTTDPTFAAGHRHLTARVSSGGFGGRSTGHTSAEELLGFCRDASAFPLRRPAVLRVAVNEILVRIRPLDDRGHLMTTVELHEVRFTDGTTHTNGVSVEMPSTYADVEQFVTDLRGATDRGSGSAHLRSSADAGAT
ncbi:MAG: hypothetical protein AAGE98_21525 [Actinomycetota bacterium]